MAAGNRMSITSCICWDHPGVTVQVHPGLQVHFRHKNLSLFLGGNLCKPEKIGLFLGSSMLHRHGMKRIKKEPPTKTMGSFKEFPEISFSKSVSLSP